ncbi:MAG: glycosyltransferase family 4 protein [Candidatus Omnitrophota bacterium]|jgi:glycosyltransferase involved in cell wall biosynthesis
MRALNICFFTQQYGCLWSGVGTYATNLINALSARGHQITVVTAEDKRRDTGHVPRNVGLVTVPVSSWDPSAGHWFSLARGYARMAKAFARSRRFDIFHFTDAREALFFSCPEIPAVGTMNDYYFIDVPANPLAFRKFYKDWVKRYLYYQAVHAVEPKALRKLSAVISNSQFLKEELMEKYRISGESMYVVYLGVVRDNIRQVACLDKMEGNPSILFVGANFQRKGLPVLIKAAAMLKPRYPSVKVYVVGKDANEPGMRKMCRDAGLEENFCFLGWLENKKVRELYGKLDMFVMPSLIEGFGLTFLEAMNAGIPVIGGDVGGTKELIRDGITGFLIPPGDCQRLCRNIILLQENPGLKQGIVARAYALAGDFSIDKMADNTLAVYDKVISRE